MDKCYSINEEEFNLDGIGEVIDALESNTFGDENIVGRKYWEADAIPYTHSDILCGWRLHYFLENCDEALGDEIMDFESLYADVGKEAKEELQEILIQWAEKHVDVSRYYKIRNVVENTITLEDLQ